MISSTTWVPMNRDSSHVSRSCKWLDSATFTKWCCSSSSWMSPVLQTADFRNSFASCLGEYWGRLLQKPVAFQSRGASSSPGRANCRAHGDARKNGGAHVWGLQCASSLPGKERSLEQLCTRTTDLSGHWLVPWRHCRCAFTNSFCRVQSCTVMCL